MGCGGSRADAIIEPRYHESWTRETESTWLTNTDVETSLPVATSKSIRRLHLSVLTRKCMYLRPNYIQNVHKNDRLQQIGLIKKLKDPLKTHLLAVNSLT
uniref:Brain and acute leukemia cytoplasmic protein n=1 Tax=Dicentrarchus labrax TaxID=13489 RepID=A0A8C4NRU0_DICLA